MKALVRNDYYETSVAKVEECSHVIEKSEHIEVVEDEAREKWESIYCGSSLSREMLSSLA